jgi:hypothetical protein
MHGRKTDGFLVSACHLCALCAYICGVCVGCACVFFCMLLPVCASMLLPVCASVCWALFEQLKPKPVRPLDGEGE